MQVNIVLTSSLGGSFKVNGKRDPSIFLTDNGLLIAWSAGSMNCASNVYAAPEFEGKLLIQILSDGFPGWD